MADEAKEDNFAEENDGSKSNTDINTVPLQSGEICNKSQTEMGDEELTLLLDSALEDFCKPAVFNTSDQVPKVESICEPKSESLGICNIVTVDRSISGDEPSDVIDGLPAPPPPAAEVQGSPATWSDEFLQQVTAQFQDAVKALEEEDPKAAEDVKQFAELATKAATESVTESDFAASLSQALKGLSDNAELLSQNPIPLSEDDIANMFCSLGNETGTDSSISDITNMMQTMMQSLLSKELLYPVLHDITDKYPEWLAENRSKLEPAQFEKYNTQFHIMKQVCEVFEEETEADTAEIKQSRFVRVLGLMQKMQDCGQPPTELVGDKVAGVEFDENGMPKIPGFGTRTGAEQCKLM